MTNAARPHPKAQLQHAGLSPKHHFGQNFLADASLCARIAKQAAPEHTQLVIEIGAGLGALTAELLDRATHVVAIERDRDLVPRLRDAFGEAVAQDRLSIVEADAKTFDYASEFSRFEGTRTLCGNLPYQITGPLLRRSLELAPWVQRCSYLVQLEVADRLTAGAGTDAYGALSVFLQARFSVRREFVVKRGAFYPQPNVDSAVIVLEPLAQPISEETPLFRAFVKSAFLQRRKKLRNAWAGVGGLSREGLAGAANEAGIDLDLRGEVLSVEQFACITRAASACTQAESA